MSDTWDSVFLGRGYSVHMAQVYSLPKTLSPGGPGHGPEGIDINTIIRLIPLCIYTI